MHHVVDNPIHELSDGDHHNKEIYQRMNMIGKKRFDRKNKNLMFFFSSVTIERQANEIRLRIRNLTTEDQGLCLDIYISMNLSFFFVNRYMGMCRYRWFRTTKSKIFSISNQRFGLQFYHVGS